MLANNAYVFPGDTQNIDVRSFHVLFDYSDTIQNLAHRSMSALLMKVCQKQQLNGKYF